MFRISRYFAVTVLSLCVYMLVRQLFSTPTLQDDTTLLQQVASERTRAAACPYTQHREGVRRDLYEGSGVTRRHAYYTAGQADMVWQPSQGQCNEYLTDINGLIDTEDGQLRIKSPKAICLSHPMTLTLDMAEALRIQNTQTSLLLAKKAVWGLPNESSQPWYFEAEGVQVRMRPQ